MSDSRIAYAVDLGGTTIKAGVVDRSWDILWRSSIPTRAGEGPEAVLDDVVQLVSGARGDVEAARGGIAGIGVGLPGLVQSEAGVTGTMVNLPGWEGFAAADYLRDRLGIEARIDHDLRVVTTGEMLCGAARGLRNFALVAVGTGIGVCIVIEGEIYRRSTGDLGHVTIDYEGRTCSCGGVGCLERYASGSAVVEEIENGLREGKIETRVSPATLAERARGGHAWAKEVFDRAGTCLGFGLVNLVALVNPEIVIIGGGLARAGEVLLEPAITVLEQHAYMFANPRERVRPAQLGADAGIIGAASLVFGSE